MKYAEVTENVKKLVESPQPKDEFIYELLLAYGTPKATIARLKSGAINLSKKPGEVLLKKKVYFKCPDSDLFAEDQTLLSMMEELKAEKKIKANDPRFLIVTDFEQILAIDRKNDDTLDIEFKKLKSHFDFFLPLTPGLDKHKLSNENPADVKAAEKMAKLFDVIKQENPEYVRDNPHWMNIFLSRLLFCLFAEDTGIFDENAVSNTIASHTADDGSDLTEFFTTLFNLLDSRDREGLPEHLKVFPYVNGGLFRDHYPVPQFTRKSRRMLIEAGTLDWKDINPDIFGSMFQAVIDPDERHNLGQHYTSVTNIMKVIEPLFLNEFKEELERAKSLSQKNVRSKALDALHDRIAKVKIFDPACGSGNFLIIAYKELRKLEMELFEAQNAFPVSRITVDQFYGIEIDDFACGTAVLALWLAEHQMNLEYEKRFGHSLTSLPLKDGANIVCDNAARKDWEEVCSRDLTDEVYVLGNPPYLGSSLQSDVQKGDMACVFNGVKNYKNLDYIACWFFKGANYIKNSESRFAFVSTNSICQGEQVALLWPHLFDKGLEIGFAHQSFKWTNNAKGSAGVTCVIIGLRKQSQNSVTVYRDGVSQKTNVVNAYLTTGSSAIVTKKSEPISNMPKMSYGNKSADGGNLILSTKEKDEIIQAYPEAEDFICPLVGASEFIKGTCRWCLWIDDSKVSDAKDIPPLADRIEKVKRMREESKKAATRELASVPHRFAEIRHSASQSIIIPAHTSENRQYIPFGFLDSSAIVTNSSQVIYNSEPWVFGVISSRMHMSWVRATCGMLETRIRYSSALCYNTFPIPDLTEEQKQTITMHVQNVLQERENESGKTMAQLYDPDKMPAGLREAHHNLDLAVDRLYRSKSFTSDEERLEHLFKLYEEMTAKGQLV